jgi:hypothetical protein
MPRLQTPQEAAVTKLQMILLSTPLDHVPVV